MLLHQKNKKMSVYELVYRIKLKLRIILYKLFNKRHFGAFGRNVTIVQPLKIEGKKNIFLGDHVSIANLVWLAALPHTGEQTVRLKIGSGTSIGHFNHIYATKSIIIGKDVLTADKVYISDNQHGYDDIKVPVIKQSVRQCNAVEIGDGTWLGENVCVIGASIGKHSVIGANSVVTHDIPDYCVAVGSPARVIKRYDKENGLWVKIKE